MSNPLLAICFLFALYHLGLLESKILNPDSCYYLLLPQNYRDYGTSRFKAKSFLLLVMPGLILQTNERIFLDVANLNADKGRICRGEGSGG